MTPINLIAAELLLASVLFASITCMIVGGREYNDTFYRAMMLLGAFVGLFYFVHLLLDILKG